MAFTLPRMPSALPSDYEQFKLWWASAFLPWWQQTVEAIEAQEARQDQAATDLAAVVAGLAAAVADITAAQADIIAVTTSDKISSSWTVPAKVLTAVDAGTDVTITIANHTRLYGDGSQLAVTGGTFTGKAYSTNYGVYYDDLTCADTTPAYGITTTLSNAQNNFVAGRHRVGDLVTPGAGGAATSGGTNPPGSGGEDRDRYSTL